MEKAASFLSSLLGGACGGAGGDSGVDPDIPHQVLRGISVPQAPVTPFDMVSFDSILVDGCHPYTEDLWKTLKINKLSFQGVKLCECCKVPTVNQENGEFGTKPTETMRIFWSGEVIRPSHKNKRKVYFGQNLVCKESVSAKGKGMIVKVGDTVYVLQTYPSPNEAPA